MPSSSYTVAQPVTDFFISLNIPLSSLACNRLILSLRDVYFRGGGAHSRTPTLTTVRSPNHGNDFNLCTLRSPGHRAGQNVGSMDSSWDQETDKASEDAESLSPASATGHSRDRSFVGVSLTRGGSSPTLSPTSAVPLFGQVTITRTRLAVTDEGVEYDFPEEELEGTSTAEQYRGRTVDWRNSKVIVQGGAVQDASANFHLLRSGVYESRVGYRHDRIPV